MLTASSSDVSSRAVSRAPQDVLRDRLLLELQEKNPGVALTHLQEAVNGRPSLAKHCVSIARALGRAGGPRVRPDARPGVRAPGLRHVLRIRGSRPRISEPHRSHPFCQVTAV